MRASLLALVATTALVDVCADAKDGDAKDKALGDARNAQLEVDALQEELMRRMQELEDEIHHRKVPLMAKGNDAIKGVKGFWARVIENHQGHAQWLRPGDREMLQYLEDVTVEANHPGHDEGHKFKVILRFKRNNFFANDELYRVVNHAYTTEEDDVSGVTWLSGNRKAWEPSFFNYFEKKTSPEHHIDVHTVNDISHVLRYELWANPFTYHDLATFSEIAAQQEHEALVRRELEADGDIPVDNSGKSAHELAEAAQRAHEEAMRRANDATKGAEKEGAKEPAKPPKKADKGNGEGKGTAKTADEQEAEADAL